MKIRLRYLLFAVLPNIVLLLLFYSLAAHMYFSLGAWPESIGERGFSFALTTHAVFTGYYFIALLLLSLFVFPVAITLCLLVRKWRASSIYFVLTEAFFFISLGIMQLAPSQFLYWWRD